MKIFALHIKLVFLFLLLSLLGKAQRQADNWYFGNKAGISFRTGTATPLYDGELQNWEGSAVISDTLGNLLFYTNGITVWNAMHDTLANGTDLQGDSSSSQAAIIIPLPENKNRYFIFTTDDIYRNGGETQTDGLRYSIVDMEGDNGLGEIIEKNTTLLDSVSEKLTSVYHANGRDIWVLAHEWNNAKFYAWLVTPGGISPFPVISEVGTPHDHIQENFYINGIGYMKLAPTGQKLVSVVKRAQKVDILDFDDETGVVSNPLTVKLPNSPYGAEFSPDLSKLYVTDDLSIYQFDITSADTTAIQASMREIYRGDSYAGAVQAGQDGSLYVALDDKGYLGVIRSPNLTGAACDFTPTGVFLDGRNSRLGLPNFIQSWFITQPILVEPHCPGDSSFFTMRNVTNYDSLEWNFDDPESGAANISTELPGAHVYTQSGNFRVTLTYWLTGIAQKYRYTFYVEDLPALDLGSDTTFCVQDTLLLNAYRPHLIYSWQDFSTDSVFLAQESGAYSVHVQDIYTGCKNSDTINLIFSDIPEIDLGPDARFCETGSYNISAYKPGFTYKWQDNSTDSIFETTEEGTFYVDIFNPDGCSNSDTISLSHKLLPRFDLGNDTIICDDASFYVEIDLPENDTEFSWFHSVFQDSTYDGYYEFFEPDTVFVTAKNSCGTWQDSLKIGFRYCGEVIIPNVFTPDESGLNDFFYIKGISEQVWRLFVYNRWGNLMYQSFDYQNDWVAEGLDSGVYYYLLECEETRDKFTGFVHVLR